VEFVQDPATKEPFPSETRLTQRIVAAALQRQVMIIGGMSGLTDDGRGDQLQITPSFTITEAQIDTAVAAIHGAIEQVKRDLSL
ncbi:MAG: aspartate aminotransferase family protein, partial [Chloroflexota bacterium]